MKPRFISLFSGIGLHDLGLVRAGWEVAAQCETDPWCRAVLDKHWPGVTRWEDIRDIDEESVRAVGRVELVTGGFPCPDISCAGRGLGLLRGERSSLWLEMLRVVRLARPALVLAENVPALRSRGIDSVLHGLEEEGYAAWPVVVGAWALGAPQRRDRVWIVGVAHDHGTGLRLEPGGRDGAGWAAEAAEPGGGGEGMGDTAGLGEREPEHSGDAFASRGKARPLPGGRGARMAGGDGAGLEKHGGERGDPRSQLPAAFGGGWPGWCAGRGEEQYPWEPARTIAFPQRFVGGEPAGGSGGVDGAAGGGGKRALRVEVARKRQARYEKWCNGQRLKALGNANPPGVPELIGRLFLNFLETKEA